MSVYYLASLHSCSGQVLRFVSCSSGTLAITNGPPVETDSEASPGELRGIRGIWFRCSVHPRRRRRRAANRADRPSSALSIHLPHESEESSNGGAQTRPCLRQNALATARATSETAAANTRLEQCTREQLRGRSFRRDADRGTHSSTCARRIVDRQGYVDTISIRPQGQWTAHLVLNSPALADMASTSCSISDRFILNDHRPVAVRPKAGARAKKQPIQRQATDCHVEVCDPEVTATSSKPAVGLGDKTLLTLERLDQSCAICCAGPIVRGTRGALRPTLLRPNENCV